MADDAVNTGAARRGRLAERRKVLGLTQEDLAEAYASDSLGYAEFRLGNHTEALACFLRALSLSREIGDRILEADMLTHPGDARHAGELSQARHAWQQALAIHVDLGNPDADQVRAKLAETED